MEFLSFIPNTILSICEAILLLILAFIVASIVRSIVKNLLKKTKLNDLATKANEDAPAVKVDNPVDYIGQLIYLLVFLLFIPGIFSVLGVSSITDPILGLLNDIWGFVPNILAAVVVLVIGTMIARLVRQLLIPVFEKINVNKLQEKAGIEVTEEAKLSNTLAYVVYVFIMIPVIIVALQALSINAITGPAVSMLDKVFYFIPNIVVALVLIWIGLLIGKFAGGLVKQLISSSGIDATIGKLLDGKYPNFVFSKVTGIIVQVVIDIFFIIQSINVLGLEVLNDIGTTIISYMPNVLAAVLILIGAFLISNMVDNALEKNGLSDYKLVTRIAIIVLAVFMVLNQLKIAATLVNAAFILIIGALAVAFAISFGVGGRDFAKTQLNKLSELLDKNKK